jgi:hypothetical protein
MTTADTTTTTYAELVAWNAMDISGGSHLNIDRSNGALGALAFLHEVTDYFNADPDLVAQIGGMPSPMGVSIDAPEATTIVYADRSAIRFGWNGDGSAEVMELLPHWSAEPTATYY